VPAPGPGVCLVCCGPVAPGSALCFACRTVARWLGLPLAPVVPVRLCPLPGPLYAVLMGYKESPVGEARHRFTPMVRALLDDFLAVHAPCLAVAAGGPLDLVLPVPSTTRPGGSPLAGVGGLAEDVGRRIEGVRWSPRALLRGRAPVGHMRPDADAFAVPPAERPGVGGTRCLLLDDTYVSGARAQSAAAALRLAGAQAVVIVALGRVLRPDRVPAHAAFLRQAARDVRAGRPCARCVQAGAPTE
jgi:hypothetical protein